MRYRSGSADSTGPPVRTLGAEDHAVKLEERAERDGITMTSRPVTWSRPGDQAVTDLDDPACDHSIWLPGSYPTRWRRTGRSWRRQAFRTRRIGGPAGAGGGAMTDIRSMPTGILDTPGQVS
jgi:hypothetical protein